LRTLNRLLHPNGHLIINSHRNPHSLAATVLRWSGRNHEGVDLHYFKLKRLLREHGFEIVRSQPIGVWMYRARLMAADPTSPRVQKLEARFSHSLFTPIAPDALVIAKKARPL
jgi:hypothetical protein